MLARKDSNSSQLVAPDSRSAKRDIGRDFFSNISSDINGFAAQTSNMFSDIFGKQTFAVSIIFILLKFRLNKLCYKHIKLIDTLLEL